MITKDRLAEKMCELRKNHSPTPAHNVLWELLVDSLSETESKIFSLVIGRDDGFTADEIADKLGLGLTNVSNYLKRMVGWGLLKREKKEKMFLYSAG
jgi:predicted transcriptional regulator